MDVDSLQYHRDRLSTYVYDPVTDTFSHKTDPSRPVSPIYEKPKVLKEHKRERRKNQRYLFLNIFRGRKGWVFEVNDVLCRFDYNYESVCDADLQLNQIIVSVAPELFLARDSESLCEWPDALECSHRLIESGIHTRD